jgi:hypothetical protein
VEKSGFKKLIRPDVILHVQDALAIDFEMAVGSVSDSITVQAGAPLVNTLRNNQHAGGPDRRGEHAAERAQLPDAHHADAGRGGDADSVRRPGPVQREQAMRERQLYFTVDEVSANFGVTDYPPLVQAAGGALPAFSAPGGTNSLVSVDTMQEFRVQTSSFAPEFGRMPGGQISIVTRSGSNQCHGTAFEYFRNSVMDANNWFANAHHLPKPEEQQNDFGGVFGGPLLNDKPLFPYEDLRLG